MWDGAKIGADRGFARSSPWPTRDRFRCGSSKKKFVGSHAARSTVAKLALDPVTKGMGRKHAHVWCPREYPADEFDARHRPQPHFDLPVSALQDLLGGMPVALGDGGGNSLRKSSPLGRLRARAYQLPRWATNRRGSIM